MQDGGVNLLVLQPRYERLGGKLAEKINDRCCNERSPALQAYRKTSWA